MEIAILSKCMMSRIGSLSRDDDEVAIQREGGPSCERLPALNTLQSVRGAQQHSPPRCRSKGIRKRGSLKSTQSIDACKHSVTVV
jgi:hypothetical protein